MQYQITKRRLFMMFVLPVFFLTILAIFMLGRHSDEGQPEEVRLTEAVDSLSSQPFGFVDLGVPEPARSDVTEYIVEQGGKAGPLLIDAIRSDDCLKVGYVAFCLKQIGSTDGVDVATKRLTQISKSNELHYKKRFAERCLEEYLMLKDRRKEKSE